MKIINCQTLGELCEFMLDGEPVFIIRAQDASALEGLEGYFKATEKNRGKNLGRTRDQMGRIKKWQLLNPARVKVAD